MDLNLANMGFISTHQDFRNYVLGNEILEQDDNIGYITLQSSLCLKDDWHFIKLSNFSLRFIIFLPMTSM